MKINEQEVVRSYMMAKERGKQVKILADLNCCSKEDIMDILKRNGVEVNGRIFNGGNHKNPMKTSVSNVKPESPKEPEKELFKVKPADAAEVLAIGKKLNPSNGNQFLQEKPEEKTEEKTDNQVEPEADIKADPEAVPEPEIVPASVIELVENEVYNLQKINNDLFKRINENVETLKELHAFLDSHKAAE